MKVMITGSSGQVGRCLVQQISKMERIDAVAFDRDELDIGCKESVLRTVTKFTPDVIINAAAYTAVDKAEDEVSLCYSVNRDGPRYLAEAANSVGAAIIHISTDYVFSGTNNDSYRESDETQPKSVYGKSKLAGEVEVATACRRHVILRTSWVFSEYGNNFVKSMLNLAKNRDELGIVSDQFGAPTYAGDIAKALLDLAFEVVKPSCTNFGIYHFSGMPHVSWYEFASLIFEEASKQGLLTKSIVLKKISTSEFPTEAKRPNNSRLNLEKIQVDYGIRSSSWKLALIDLKRYIN